MNTSQSSQDIMHQIIDQLSHQPWFPVDYCNIASKALFQILEKQGKNVRLQYSHKKEGEGHRFVVEKILNWEEIILDPTYGQYDNEYPLGFIGKEFPDSELEKNRTEAIDFMKKQQEWFKTGVYDKIFKAD